VILRVSEKRALSILGSNGDEVTEGWRKLQNEKLCFSLNVVVMVKARSWAGYVASVQMRKC
jgi:hypothetical protein